MNTNQTQPRRTGKQRGKYLATRHSHIVRYPANNLLYLYWKHKGKRYEQSLETDVESVALVKADEKIKKIKERLQTNAPVTNGKISLGEVLSHYLAQEKRRVEAHEIRAKTLEAIEDGVKKIRREQAALLSREAARITFKELDDYVHGIRKSQSPTTVNKVVDALKKAYERATEDNLIATDPTRKLKRSSIHGVKSEIVPTDEEYAALIQHFRASKLSHKYHVIDLIEFLRFFGLRIDEARKVLKSDVDLKARVLKVRKEIAKRGKAREVPIFDEALPLIERLLVRTNLRIYGKAVRKDNLLAIGKCYGALRSACKELELPNFTHHTFRHLAGTKWLECGVNPKQAATWLGHADGGALLLRIYAHARKEHAQAEAKKVRWGTQEEPTGDVVVLNGVPYPKAKLEEILKSLPAAKNVVPVPGTAAA